MKVSKPFLSAFCGDHACVLVGAAINLLRSPWWSEMIGTACIRSKPPHPP